MARVRLTEEKPVTKAEAPKKGKPELPEVDGKKPTTLSKIKIDPQYLHEITVAVYEERINEDDAYRTRGGGMLPAERMIADYVKKYGSKEKAEKRFADHAQIYAPAVRVMLRVMAERGELPKKAMGK